jgi:hypothetical protein
MEKKANIDLLLANPNDETTNGIFLKNRNWYHLYITTDEEIKEGDWYYWSVTNTIQKAIKDSLGRLPKIEDGSKKIIATTDKSLGLASPSTSFIEKFVEEYNKGNIITKVIVEYESVEYCRPMPMVHQKYYISKVKINPKDNTITIKKVKDSWSREEVIDLLTRYNKRCQAPMVDTKWISENL